MTPLPILAAAADPRPSDHQAITGPRDIRSVRTLRISVTDRCNFRCVYCMPHDRLDWVPRAELLAFEEIAVVARAAIRLGICDFKITGGEPLLRHDLPRLIRLLRTLAGIGDLSMTTNGVLLTDLAETLRDAGLDRLTVSLDSLEPATFRDITRGGNVEQVLAGIRAACAAGFGHPKINCVVMRGVNDHEVPDFAAFARDTDCTVRFIEYMPLGESYLSAQYDERFVSEADIRRWIEQRFGPLIPAGADAGHGPAKVFHLPGGRGRIGFISAMSKPFCDTCNRLRLTAEGQLRSCLFDGGEIELRPLLRDERSMPANFDAPPIHDVALRDAFVRCVAFKPDLHDITGNRQMSQIGG